MKQKTRKVLGGVLIYSSLVFLLVHAIIKLNANISDYQHWGVIGAAVLIFLGGMLMKK